MMHGGDIYRNKITLDFSVNVNPLGIPREVKRALRKTIPHCTEYPDILAQELKNEIGSMYGMSSKHILCGNGASELFTAITHGIGPKRIGIPVPSFGGYEYAATAAGSEIIYYPMKREEGFCFNEALLSHCNADMLILANPNNPVGNIIDRESMESLVKECCRKHIILVVDECFIEFTGREKAYSLKELTGKFHNLIVVRAFTKIFSIPGVRLGYLFCQNYDLLKKISAQLSEWNLSAFAQSAGKAACREIRYQEKTAALIKREREYLTQNLKQIGIHVFPSEANFLLLQTKLPLYEELLRRKILIRECSSFHGLERGYYRIAVKKHVDNQKLIRAICAVLQGRSERGR